MWQVQVLLLETFRFFPNIFNPQLFESAGAGAPRYGEPSSPSHLLNFPWKRCRGPKSGEERPPATGNAEEFLQRMQRRREGFGPTSANGGPAWTGRGKDGSGSQLAPFLELARSSEGRRGTGDTSRGGGNPGRQLHGPHSWHPVCMIKRTRSGWISGEGAASAPGS